MIPGWLSPCSRWPERLSRWCLLAGRGMNAAAALLVGMSAIDNSGSCVAGRLSDGDASALARQAVDGSVPELQVRWALLAEVRQADIAASVAARHMPSPRTAANLVELTDQLNDLLTDRIVGVDREASLKLEMIAHGASLHGWARQFCRGSVGRALMSARRRATRHLPLDDSRHLNLVSGVSDPEEDSLDEIASSFADQARRLRHAGAVHLKARVLCEVFSLPAPPRMVDHPRRVALLAALEKAAQSRTAAREVASDVGAVWREWPDEQRASLDGLDPRILCLLMTASLTPTPPPQTRVIARFGALLERHLGEDGPNLLRAWSEAVTELDRSEFSPTGSPKLKTRSLRNRHRARFDRMAQRLVDSGTTELGDSPEAISQSLFAGLIRVEAELAAA